MERERERAGESSTNLVPQKEAELEALGGPKPLDDLLARVLGLPLDRRGRGLDLVDPSLDHRLLREQGVALGQQRAIHQVLQRSELGPKRGSETEHEVTPALEVLYHLFRGRGGGTERVLQGEGQPSALRDREREREGGREGWGERMQECR